jgi:hypothetical protein
MQPIMKPERGLGLPWLAATTDSTIAGGLVEPFERRDAHLDRRGDRRH